MHLEFDCKITNFFGIKMPQPYIEPEILTDSPTIQEVYSLEEDKSTGKDCMKTNVPLYMTFVRPYMAIFCHMYVHLSQN